MKKLKKITEIRVEEIHEIEEKQRFYRVYFHYSNGKVELKEDVMEGIIDISYSIELNSCTEFKCSNDFIY